MADQRSDGPQPGNARGHIAVIAHGALSALGDDLFRKIVSDVAPLADHASHLRGRDSNLAGTRRNLATSETLGDGEYRGDIWGVCVVWNLRAGFGDPGHNTEPGLTVHMDASAELRLSRRQSVSRSSSDP